MSTGEQRCMPLFPLPFITYASPAKPHSRHIQQRQHLRRYTINAANLVIQSLNAAHSPSSYQPFRIPFTRNQSVYTTLYTTDYTSHDNQTPSFASQYSHPTKAQQRVHDHIEKACWRMLHVSHRDTAPASLSDDTVIESAECRTISSSVFTEALALELGDDFLKSPSMRSTAELDLRYTVKADALPIIASKVSLPSQLTILPMLSLLDSHNTQLYCQPSDNVLLTTSQYNVRLSELQQTGSAPRPAMVLGSAAEYLKLVTSLYHLGMVSFTTDPKCVNGIFAVPKPDGTQRIIIDAQPANLHFTAAPYVSLPSPSHLARLRVKPKRKLYVAKMDLSNFYHHIGLPQWMQPYFCLPAIPIAQVSPELAQKYGDIRLHPMCATLPMGFSHSVYIAQHIHHQCLYASSAMDPRCNILQLRTPYVTSPIHMLYIDDNCILGTSMAEVDCQYQASMAAYSASGLVVKAEKCVAPTSSPTEILGILINGSRCTMAAHPSKTFKLLGQTLYLIRCGTCTGTTLSRLMGHWTWLLMLRRPIFAILRYSYIFIQEMQGRSHQLWPAVINELYMLVALAPLMYADLTTPLLDILPASDASSLGNGVVLGHTTAEGIQALYPLAVYNAKQHVTDDNQNGLLHPTTAQREVILNAQFATVISHTWRYTSPHINELELQSVLSMLKHLVSRPRTLHSSILHLIDNQPAFSCLRKGRSSSVRLLPVLKKISAHLLAHDITLLSVWVPTEINPADRPSRYHRDAIHI